MSGITIVMLVIATIWATTALLTIVGRVVHILASAVFAVLIAAALAAFIARILVGPRSKKEER